MASRKVFVGNLPYSVSRQSFSDFFEQYGPVQEALLMVDEKTNTPRGFGFIVFEDESSVDKVTAEREILLDGRPVKCSRAIPKGEIQSNPMSVKPCKKIYIGGTRGLSESAIKSYFQDRFSHIGGIESVELMKFHDTGKDRGFGFVTFDNYQVVDKICAIKDHSIEGVLTTCTKAEPKESRDARLPKQTMDIPSHSEIRHTSGRPDVKYTSGGVPFTTSRDRDLHFADDLARVHERYRNTMPEPRLMREPEPELRPRRQMSPEMVTRRTASPELNPDELDLLEEEIAIREEELKLRKMKLQVAKARARASAVPGGHITRSENGGVRGTLPPQVAYGSAADPERSTQYDFYPQYPSSSGPVRARDQSFPDDEITMVSHSRW